ncbi:MAG: 30S ribosomal protein S9 [Candidatus Melainabacteria bacterium]|nr:30S ribosomal protein S9 [Candidatus Melainabacteria bacterium]MBI3309639.1 30S ribosomal protein S9 [Candidatus Melainabacteria bacterium]
MGRIAVKSKRGLYQATGRRKTAIARVFLKSNGSGKFIINGKAPDKHLGNVDDFLNLIKKPLQVISGESKYDVFANVEGGGLSGQADAIRLGIARALVKQSESNKQKLKDQGLLTRDPRDKERKKYGRKRARKRFQYSKR